MSKLMSTIEIEEPELEAVIQIAEDMINRNKLIDMKKIFRIAKRKLKYSTKNLFLIIRKLFDENYIIEGSKLIREKLLKNPYRAVIYNFIKEHPGVNFSTIKKFVFSRKDKRYKILLESKSPDFGSSGQFIWHLEILLKFKCIKKVEFGNFSLFIPYDMDENLAIYYFLLRDNINRNIFNLLLEKGKMKQADVPKFFEKPRGTIYYHIKAMNEANILFSEKINKRIHISTDTFNKSKIVRIKDDIELELVKLKEKYKPSSRISEEKITTEKLMAQENLIAKQEDEQKEKVVKDIEKYVDIKPDEKKKEYKEKKDKNEKKKLKDV